MKAFGKGFTKNQLWALVLLMGAGLIYGVPFYVQSKVNEAMIAYDDIQRVRIENLSKKTAQIDESWKKSINQVNRNVSHLYECLDYEPVEFMDVVNLRLPGSADESVTDYMEAKEEKKNPHGRALASVPRKKIKCK